MKSLPKPQPTLEELQRLLEGKLEPTREVELYEWVEHHPETRSRLEKLSGADCLIAQFDPEVGPVLPASAEEGESEPDYVSFLSPCEHPGSLGELGKFPILTEIGRGGMSIVLQAIDPDLNRIVAIKWLDPRASRSKSASARFQREANAVAAIDHPHVLPIYSVETVQERPMLVSRYVEGETLESYLKRNPGGLPVEETVDVAIQIAQALEAAHEKGLIHRDVKPSNIMLEPREDSKAPHVWLMDFGLVKTQTESELTYDGTLVGTPHYMSPEQANGKKVDRRTDLYSLGVVLFRMLTGTVPFDGDHLSAVLWQISQIKSPRVRSIRRTIPRWYEYLVRQLLAKNASDRPRDAAEVIHFLETRGREWRRKRTRRYLIQWGVPTAVCTGAGGMAFVALTSNKDISLTGSVKDFRYNITEAFSSAEDGDVIDLNFDGESLLDPLRLNKSFTVRGNPDVQSVIRIHLTDKPGIANHRGRTLTLENVEIRVTVSPESSAAVIHWKDGTLRLINSRIIVENESQERIESIRINPIVALEEQGTLEIENCVFYGPARESIYWTGDLTSMSMHIRVMSSVFYSHTAFAFGVGKAPVHVICDAEKNFCVGNRALALIRKKDKEGFYVPRNTFQWRNNIFDSQGTFYHQDYAAGQTHLSQHLLWNLEANRLHQPGVLFDSVSKKIRGPRTIEDLNRRSINKKAEESTAHTELFFPPLEELKTFERTWEYFQRLKLDAKDLQRFFQDS